jgi:hypothetical protein
MKRLLMAFMLATLIGPVFVQAASATSRGDPYWHESSCMYRGYPCSEWKRDDGW